MSSVKSFGFDCINLLLTLYNLLETASRSDFFQVNKDVELLFIFEMIRKFS